ncbi:hypothetical protein GCM10011586_35940 [Silvibacterium dinghuense]|nr:hypothetical protein GCM10011586_35940 [Silvibacterium dinghuense]
MRSSAKSGKDWPSRHMRLRRVLRLMTVFPGPMARMSKASREVVSRFVVEERKSNLPLGLQWNGGSRDSQAA